MCQNELNQSNGAIDYGDDAPPTVRKDGSIYHGLQQVKTCIANETGKILHRVLEKLAEVKHHPTSKIIREKTPHSHHHQQPASLMV